MLDEANASCGPGGMENSDIYLFAASVVSALSPQLRGSIPFTDSIAHEIRYLSFRVEIDKRDVKRNVSRWFYPHNFYWTGVAVKIKPNNTGLYDRHCLTAHRLRVLK